MKPQKETWRSHCALLTGSNGNRHSVAIFLSTRKARPDFEGRNCRAPPMIGVSIIRILPADQHARDNATKQTRSSIDLENRAKVPARLFAIDLQHRRSDALRDATARYAKKARQICKIRCCLLPKEQFHAIMDRSIQSTGQSKSDRHLILREGEMLKMVRVNGSPSANSKTGVLVDAVGDAIAKVLPVESTTIALHEYAMDFMCGLTRADITARGEWLAQQAEQADILVVGTPVYRASYTGVFKHFFDIVDKDVLRGRKAVLCATGGTAMHGLVLEHQLRALMSFFSMHTMPTALFGLSEDFHNGQVVSKDLKDRISRVADEVSSVLASEHQRAVA